MIIGSERSAIGTLVERSTRFTMLLHLPRMAGYGVIAPVKNGPALGGYGAQAMKDAIAAKITTLPHALRQTLTWDRGKELAAHAQLSIDTGVQVYFADPHSPWQRGTNENTNGLPGNAQITAVPGAAAQHAAQLQQPFGGDMGALLFHH